MTAGPDTRGRRTPLVICMVHYSEFRLDSRIQRQARALAARGDEVHLFCLGEAEVARVGDGTISVHPVPVPKVAGGAAAYMGGYARFFAGAARRLSAFALKRRVDLVEAHNMPDFLSYSALVPKLRGAPVLLNLHDTFPELFATKFGYADGHAIVRGIRLEERVSAAIANHLITVTEEARERIASRHVGRGRTSVVMNSPDTEVFGPAREPVELPESGPIRVLYHGGLAPRFGVETLIRAFGHLSPALPEITLRVCGSGEDRDRLAALAAEIAPDRIDVAPEPVPFADIPAELRAAHIGVVPTLHDSFTELLLPVKLLEYVHMGLPVLASDLPGITRYFDDRSVWLFEPGSPASLAAGIASVCLQPDKIRQRASRATEQLASIAWEQQKSSYLALVDDLVHRRKPRRHRLRSLVAAAQPTR